MAFIRVVSPGAITSLPATAAVHPQVVFMRRTIRLLLPSFFIGNSNSTTFPSARYSWHSLLTFSLISFACLVPG